MFMIFHHAKEGVKTAQVVIPPVGAGKSRKKGKHRSRRQWMTAMHEKVLQLKSRYYAFRYMGRWHVCDAFDPPDKDPRFLPGDARLGVEMMLVHLEEAHRG